MSSGCLRLLEQERDSANTSPNLALPVEQEPVEKRNGELVPVKYRGLVYIHVARGSMTTVTSLGCFIIPDMCELKL